MNFTDPDYQSIAAQVRALRIGTTTWQLKKLRVGDAFTAPARQRHSIQTLAGKLGIVIGIQKFGKEIIVRRLAKRPKPKGWATKIKALAEGQSFTAPKSKRRLILRAGWGIRRPVTTRAISDSQVEVTRIQADA